MREKNSPFLQKINVPTLFLLQRKINSPSKYFMFKALKLVSKAFELLYKALGHVFKALEHKILYEEK